MSESGARDMEELDARFTASLKPLIDRITALEAGREDTNARLIASAPDLLDIAKLFQRSIEYEIRKSKNENDEEGARLKTFTLNMVSAAIAKAEGGES